jgi:magnesium-transporting ATPase (P-type)
METILCKHWHHCSAEELATLLETSMDRGLDSFEVKHRQVRFGINALTIRKRKSPFKQFLLAGSLRHQRTYNKKTEEPLQAISSRRFASASTHLQ